MSTIGNLKVILTAKTAAFAKGMQSAGTAVHNFGSKAKAAVTSTKVLGGSLVTLAAGGGLAYMGSRAATTIDALGKTADKLGATTEGLATMRHAAALSGIESRTFDMALQRVVRRLGMAAAGAKKMGPEAANVTKLFRGLGLDAKKLAALPADEAFREWANALSQIKDPATRVAYAFKFVDSEGVGVVNMLEALGSGWKETVQLAESLGIRLGRTQVRLVERMNDAFFNLRTKSQAIMNHVLVRIAPIMEAVFKKLTDLIPDPARAAEWVVAKFKELGEAVLRFADWIRPAVLHVASAVTAIGAAILKTISAIAEFFGAELPSAIKSTENGLLQMHQHFEAVLRDLQAGTAPTFFERVTGFFRAAVKEAKSAAREYARSRIATGALALDEVADTILAKTATIRSATIGEFGGLTAAGAHAGNTAWFGGSIQLKLAEQTLGELQGIHATIKQQAGGRMGS